MLYSQKLQSKLIHKSQVFIEFNRRRKQITSGKLANLATLGRPTEKI